MVNGDYNNFIAKAKKFYSAGTVTQIYCNKLSY